MRLFRSNTLQFRITGDLDVDAQPIRPKTRFVDQCFARARYGLQMNIAVEFVYRSQLLRYAHQPLHGSIGILEDAAAQEQAFDVVAPVEVHGKVHHFFHGEGCALHIIAASAHAICTVEYTMVGEQDLQQAHATPSLCSYDNAIFCVARLVVVGPCATTGLHASSYSLHRRT